VRNRLFYVRSSGFPQELLKELEQTFFEYLDELRNPDPVFDALRRRFKTKFEDTFGVTISTEVTP
jgi:hypothetical protein